MTNILVKPAYLLSIFILLGCQSFIDQQTWQWTTVEATGKPVARHEAGLVAFDRKLYLLGGRRINQTSVFNTVTQHWKNVSPTPIEIHHFQPIVFQEKIYIIGALTGQWPNEKPVEHIITYTPKTDSYEMGPQIPEHRRRGGAGVVVYNNKIYVVGGIKNGHQSGYVPWFDEYDPATKKWTPLPDAPIARDHFQATIMNNKLYSFGGRRTSRATQQDMSLTVKYGNIYNFQTQLWETPSTTLKIPTERAGTSSIAWNNQIITGGGESMTQLAAHNEVEAFDTTKHKWTSWPTLQQGRHGTGFAIIDNYLYTASGAGNRGGGPELYSIERLKLPKGSEQGTQITALEQHQQVHKKWHTLTLNFSGPNTTELDKHNPFLHYKLEVTFEHSKTNTSITLPGYFAADGNAAQTSATEGEIWQVKFNPHLLGEWHYSATLYAGENVAINENYTASRQVNLKQPKGNFLVIPTDKQGNDFKAQGRLISKNGFFQFEHNQQSWLKVGANSPENLLGYVDFDNTYRVSAKARKGEAAPEEGLHRYLPHLYDWQTGDPVWQKNKGKALIGSTNYLANTGMNAAYFLTMNINGDGKDVWPFINHEDFTRFDVSKLAQWEIVFEHMQSKGILLHVVLQETENEMLFDNGDTGPIRKLYFNELIARFGHHLGLIWNLGEENGFADWTPNAQNTAQRKAMATHLKANDPFNHPVLLHTHSHDPVRTDILTPLLGFKDIDGLSLQVNKREEVSDVIHQWREKSQEAGHQWLITMDEIGIWHTAALPDSVDNDHHSLRRDVLWGSLLSGAAGVEWYFGANYPHNDLTSEDWRQRSNLWALTNNAKEFFIQHTPYWKISSCKIVSTNKHWEHCGYVNNEWYVLYYVDQNDSDFTTPLTESNDAIYDISWFDPINGGQLQTGSKQQISGSDVSLGKPPQTNAVDWVVLLKKHK